MKKKVLVAMSGGIDSTVAATFLKEQGYHVEGVFMKFWFDSKKDKRYEELFEQVQEIGKKLKISVYCVDYTQVFYEKVVRYFLETHQKGATPSPCIPCNTFVKFGAFLEEREKKQFDLIATGHYVRLEENNEQYILKTGLDPGKDQSYFLYHLSQKKLSKIIFPLGEYEKKQVKVLGEKYGLKDNMEDKESQGVCFFPEDSYVPFLKRHVPQLFQKGDIMFQGKKVGEHEGLPFYTIGQRRGINLGGFVKPIYVVGFDYGQNILLVDYDEALWRKEVIVKNFICTGTTNNEVDLKKLSEYKLIYLARIRHLGILNECTMQLQKNGVLKIIFKNPVRAITPGQYLVLYDFQNRVIGGGEIFF